jgi:hypothetical protein
MKEQPIQIAPSVAAEHATRAQYFRAMAATTSAADVALTMAELALHYETLALAAGYSATFSRT